ncbi:MAG: HupE/UreJ family protein [Snowella sp.]|nr:HupE/UreJ family protein [Snowella sp.]
MNNLRFSPGTTVFKPLGLGIFASLGFMLMALPASAHHMMGGKVPADFFQGFMSGIAHPLIGFDHFAFIFAVGLLAAIQQRGILIPIAFVLASMLGAGAHLATLNLSGVELGVSGSVLLFGILLTLKNRPNTATLVGLSAIAGLFHGYAYGESIFGAETTPLFAYLLGLTLIQLVVAMMVFGLSKKLLSGEAQLPIGRSAGLVLSGIGLAFLASAIVNVIVPLSRG